MATDQSTIEQLTRENIRGRMLKLQARERELTERLVVLCKSGKTGAPSPMAGRDRRIREGARALLNGAGSLLPDVPADDNEQGIIEQREHVWLALETLSRAEIQKAAIEAAEKAVSLAPEWKALNREWFLAVARFQGIEARCAAFRDMAGVEVMAAIDHGYFPSGKGTEVEQYGCWDLWGFRKKIDDVINIAVDDGVIGRREIEQAQRGKGAS